MHRGWCRGSVVGVLLVALPRRFRGRFLTIKRRFRGYHRGTFVGGSVVDASWMVSWQRRRRVAGCVATTVLWKPSWHCCGAVASWTHCGWCHGTPNVHDRGHYRWTVVGGHASYTNPRDGSGMWLWLGRQLLSPAYGSGIYLGQMLRQLARLGTWLPPISDAHLSSRTCHSVPTLSLSVVLTPTSLSI